MPKKITRLNPVRLRQNARLPPRHRGLLRTAYLAGPEQACLGLIGQLVELDRTAAPRLIGPVNVDR